MAARPGIQPAGATNNGNLLIPNKQSMDAFDSIKYGVDMRAIERWCNSLIIEIELGSIILQDQYYDDSGSGLFAYVNGSGVATPGGGGPLDTTILTFGPMVVPDSGKIRAEISFPWRYIVPIAGDAFHAMFIGLSDHSDPTHVYAPVEMIDTQNDTFAEADYQYYGRRSTYDAILLDLTPGDSIQFDLWGETSGSPGNPNGYRVLLSTGTGIDTYTGPILWTFYEA